MKKRRRKHESRRRTVLLLALAVIILSVICVAIYYKHALNQRQEESQTETEEKPEVEEESEVVEEETESESEENVSIDEMGFIFVGESHMVVADAEYAGSGSDIDGIVYGENLFFVQTGLSGWMGTAEWLVSEETQDGEKGALLQIDDILESHDFKKCYIFMQHGSSMSQYENLWSSYENVYKAYEERYSECDLFVISVPPVQEDEFLKQTGFKRSNQSIKEFNEYCRTLLKKDQYLDYYEWFEKDGNYQDYIHFEGKTYKSLFTSIMGNLLA